MKKVFKTFSLILAVLCMGLCLAACGEGSGGFSVSSARTSFTSAGYTTYDLKSSINKVNERQRYIKQIADIQSNSSLSAAEKQKRINAINNMLNALDKDVENGKVYLVKNQFIIDNYGDYSSGFVAVKDNKEYFVINLVNGYDKYEWKNKDDHSQGYNKEVDGEFVKNAKNSGTYKVGNKDYPCGKFGNENVVTNTGDNFHVVCGMNESTLKGIYTWKVADK